MEEPHCSFSSHSRDDDTEVFFLKPLQLSPEQLCIVGAVQTRIRTSIHAATPVLLMNNKNNTLHVIDPNNVRHTTDDGKRCRHQWSVSEDDSKEKKARQQRKQWEELGDDFDEGSDAEDYLDKNTDTKAYETGCGKMRRSLLSSREISLDSSCSSRVSFGREYNSDINTESTRSLSQQSMSTTSSSRATLMPSQHRRRQPNNMSVGGRGRKLPRPRIPRHGATTSWTVVMCSCYRANRVGPVLKTPFTPDTTSTKLHSSTQEGEAVNPEYNTLQQQLLDVLSAGVSPSLPPVVEVRATSKVDTCERLRIRVANNPDARDIALALKKYETSYDAVTRSVVHLAPVQSGEAEPTFEMVLPAWDDASSVHIPSRTRTSMLATNGLSRFLRVMTECARTLDLPRRGLIVSDAALTALDIICSAAQNTTAFTPDDIMRVVLHWIDRRVRISVLAISKKRSSVAAWRRASLQNTFGVELVSGASGTRTDLVVVRASEMYTSQADHSELLSLMHSNHAAPTMSLASASTMPLATLPGTEAAASSALMYAWKASMPPTLWRSHVFSPNSPGGSLGLSVGQHLLACIFHHITGKRVVVARVNSTATNAPLCSRSSGAASGASLYTEDDLSQPPLSVRDNIAAIHTNGGFPPLSLVVRSALVPSCQATKCATHMYKVPRSHAPTPMGWVLVMLLPQGRCPPIPMDILCQNASDDVAAEIRPYPHVVGCGVPPGALPVQVEKMPCASKKINVARQLSRGSSISLSALGSRIPVLSRTPFSGEAVVSLTCMCCNTEIRKRGARIPDFGKWWQHTLFPAVLSSPATAFNNLAEPGFSHLKDSAETSKDTHTPRDAHSHPSMTSVSLTTPANPKKRRKKSKKSKKSKKNNKNNKKSKKKKRKF
jgi:hypothetical protein